ncbi:MAG TPA: hypothetical protein VER04_10165 [Polyangiaceae bacterium]|nr:hypothetical protein [Polyangiaceae bacterium]
MAKSTLADEAAALAARLHQLTHPLVVDRAEGKHPRSGKPLHRFRVVSSANANGPAHAVVLDEHGKHVDAAEAPPALFDHNALSAALSAPLPALPITVSPDTNVLTLNPGQNFEEDITVTVPKGAATSRADIYFLADTTGSMGEILNAVQTGASAILSALSTLGIDMAFGVGNYKDFRSGDPFAFQHQLSPTPVAASVQAAFGAWLAGGGSDWPEGNLFALESLAVAPGGSIGWRSNSKRIIVWFGDAPGHDPICPAASGLPSSITEMTTTTKLVAEKIVVLAISTADPGLDGDPTADAADYAAVCGPPGGLAGQAKRITSATGGKVMTGIDADGIAKTIIDLVKGAVAGISHLELVPSASVAPFVTSITPAGGYGPLSGDQEHTLTFHVRFTGIPCKPEAQLVTGTLDVVVDGKPVAAKRLTVTVPACRPKGFVYSVKFVCGTQPADPCCCHSVQPGGYATQINIHNVSLGEARVVKRFVPLVLAGAPMGREPRIGTVRAEDKILLPAQGATMDDCCRIAELLYGAPAAATALTIGLVELTSDVDLAVTAIYTTSGKDGGVSIAVEQIAAKRL